MSLTEQPGVVSGELIFPLEGRPTPSCHASTVVETTDGTIAAAWFGGTAEKNPDVGIWFSRREAGRWLPPVEVADGDWTLGRRRACWNPVLHQAPAGPLLLFYKVGVDVAGWWGELLTSPNGGLTWGEPRPLPRGGIGPVKNKPFQLPDGGLLCPSSSEHDGWRVHFELTRDLGRTWEVIGPLEDPALLGGIQPSVLDQGGGKLQLLCRTHSGVVATAWSADAGRTWTPLTATDRPNPNSGTDALTLADGRHLLVYNPLEKGRQKLVVAVSPDGVAWREVVTLEDQPTGEYSYPAIIQARDGLVHVTYTWRRQSIQHVVIDPRRLTGGDR